MAGQSVGAARMYDVCIITTIHGDWDNRIYHRQLNALVDSGMRVCLIAPWNFASRDRLDFEFAATQFPPNRPARILHGLRTYLRARSTPAKCYIFHDPDFLLFAVLLKLETGRPVVYDAHENVPEDIRYGKDWIPAPLRLPISALFRLFENAAVKILGHSIVTVPHLEKRFRGLGIRPLLVRNFSRFEVSPEFHNDRAVLYTGDLTRDYGVANLIEIAREMKRRGLNTPLRIVDRFREDEETRQWFRKTVEAETLNVEILKPVPAAEMPSILGKGCIGLSPIPDLPNKALAFPTKIFEYFAFGLVVIASDIAGTRDVMRNGELGVLIRDGDHRGWVDAIERLLSDRELAEDFRLKARAAISDEFNWAGEEVKLVEYVRSLIVP